MNPEFDNKILILLDKIWENNQYLRFNQLLYIIQKGFEDGKWVNTAYGEFGKVRYPDLFNAPDKNFEVYLEEVLKNGL